MDNETSWAVIAQIASPVVITIIGFFLRNFFNDVKDHLTNLTKSVSALQRWRIKHTQRTSAKQLDYGRRIKRLETEAARRRREENRYD